jgi:CDP-6-deoxy-D-xylo-4-hexulose-3-dehydrase
LFSGNLTKQPAFVGKNFRVSSKLTNTDHIMENTFWVGLYPGLGEEELSYVVKVIKDCF